MSRLRDWRPVPLLAVNHIGDVDTFVIGVALHRAGVRPRFLVGAACSRPRSSARCSSADRRRRDPGPGAAARRGADRIGFADGTRPTTAVAAFPGGVVPDDIP